MSWLRAIPFLFTLLAFVLQPASASAFGPAHPEARVSAFELVALATVGASAETSPGLHEGIGEAYDENASGYRFAAGGKVYKVDGSKTPSGKPYVGRTKQSSPAKRGKRDGRDRTDAEIVDTYDPSDAAAARRAEQNAMNREGGLDNLDNKRNEIRPDDWETNGVDPPR